MKANTSTKITNLVLTALGLFTLFMLVEVAFAQEDFPHDDRELATLYAPVLYFHPAELFRPQSVDVMVNTARLRQARRAWLDVNVLPRVSLSDLLSYKDASYNLDAWFGDEGASDLMNYSAHCAYYQSVLSPGAGGPPIVAYAHVVRDEDSQYITIQYWLFYYYQDWFNKHEGDWEMVQVMLGTSGEPDWVVLSQHHGGTRRSWSEAKIEDGTHPAVFVALGSHANYFWGDENYPFGTTIGSVQIEIMDRTGTFGRIIPEVRILPTREEVELDPAAWAGLEWLPFRGHWGELASYSEFSGPLGPADKGAQWEQPYAWGMSQPLDVDTWYRNRLRVEVRGESAEGAQVELGTSDGRAFSSAESLGSVALLHTEPPSDEVVIADIVAPAGSLCQVLATWPDPEASEVTRFLFADVPLAQSGHAVLILGADKTPTLTVDGLPQALRPTTVETQPATWDAPDLVWVAGVLPPFDVARGLGMSLLAGLLPTLIYVAVLYHSDRYEKEPMQLLAAAFFWGALPALLVAVAVRVFFDLPVDLLGPEAVEAVRAGLVAPLIEEALKGMAVVFIAVRYRHEFDDVLDGIIYGAMTGFGFAMTGNTLSYTGAFLLRGFAGLSTAIFVEGVLYGLNHGVYTAIFGAGLGYARLAKQRWQRWAVPLGAFGLAVVTHALHNLAIRNAVGLNLLTVSVTWAGVLVILVVMAWSQRREQRCLETELVGEIPDELYRTLTVPGGRRRQQWRALRKHGWSGLRREQRVHQLCADLAFKKMQYKLRPDEVSMLDEMERLRGKVQAMLDAR